MKSILIPLLFITSLSVGQKNEYDLYSLFNMKKLTAYHRNVSLLEDNKIKGIKLDESSGEGIVWLNDIIFSTGTIEIDLRGKDVLQKSFVGIAFHGVNDSTYDAIYFRPFNFHSLDPVRKIHAVQYISHPTYTWRKLREERNGVYEKALVNPPDPNAWLYARIEVTETDVKVYVNDDKIPSLTVKKISTTTNGKIGVWVGDGSGGDFSALIITKN